MQPEFILRPVRDEDGAALSELVRTITGGMTSLPDHPETLSHRIEDSLRAFDPRIRKPGGETYLFVMEELSSSRIIGTSGLISRVGGFDPFYTYRVRKHVQAYEPLNICNELQTLDLVKNHKGPTEICSLYLHPDYRRHGLGRLLSLSRFCFIKAHPSRFDEEIIAELRGFLDHDGTSPFWEAVGKKFFHKDYYTADVLSGIGEKDFIEALLPEFPIYIDLLPFSAQSVIGKVHEHTEAARKILLKEGFQLTDEVDIFDAGPIVRANREHLESWKATRRYAVADIRAQLANPQVALVSNLSLEFRATRCDVEIQPNGTALITPQSAEAIMVDKDQDIQVMPA